MSDANGDSFSVNSFVYYNGILCRVTGLNFVDNTVSIESVNLLTRINPFRSTIPSTVTPTQLIVSRGE